MNLLEVLLFLGLLVYMLSSQLGRRLLTPKSLRRPLLMAGVLFYFLVLGVPLSGGNPGLLALAALVGIGLGFLASACVGLEVSSQQTYSTAGWAYAAVWVVSIGGRLLFGWAAFHGLGPAIMRFIAQHRLSGGDALKAAFGLMTVAEIVIRTGIVALRATALSKDPTTKTSTRSVASSNAFSTNSNNSEESFPASSRPPRII